MVESEVREANAAALDSVYRAYRGEMTAVASGMLRNRSIPEAGTGAEDIVQSAFTRALGAPEELREPRAYVYTTLRREIAHEGERMRQRHQREVAYLADGHRGTWASHDVAALVAERTIMWEALRKLPLAQRTAIVGTKMYGYTQSEMAYIAGRHPGTIAAAVSRAVAYLRLGSGVSKFVPTWEGSGFLLNNPFYVFWYAARLGALHSDGDLRVEFIALSLELEMLAQGK
ncbi:RNA polymerase sigma factor [Streptomyces goshikiensis]|uniref:RNA polymerase sigma factor n=1 Tax=Streptomyces goshikiensis TaxID=1942 RepID=UPI0037AF0BA7